MPNKTPESGKCFECEADCNSFYYCHGCKEFICANCSVNESLTPGHWREDHLDKEEEQEDDD